MPPTAIKLALSCLWYHSAWLTQICFQIAGSRLCQNQVTCDQSWSKCVTAKIPYSAYVDMKDTNCLAFVWRASTCCELMRHKDLKMAWPHWCSNILSYCIAQVSTNEKLYNTVKTTSPSGGPDEFVSPGSGVRPDEFVSPGSTPHLGMITDVILKDPWLWSGLEKVTLLGNNGEQNILAREYWACKQVNSAHISKMYWRYLNVGGRWGWSLEYATGIQI